MKYYKDSNEQIYAFDADVPQDEFTPAGLVSITEKEAMELAKKKQDELSKDFVPDSISRFQMLALLKTTRYADSTMFQYVDDYVKNLDEETPENIILKTAWGTASDFRRDSMPVKTAQRLLGLTDEQRDDLFKKASEIQV